MGLAGPGQLLKNEAVTTVVRVFGRPTTLIAARCWDEGSDSTADAYLQLFDAAEASDVTLGTTKPDWVVMSESIGQVSGGDGLPNNGLQFRKGIVIASTTTSDGNTTVAQAIRLVIS